MEQLYGDIYKFKRRSLSAHPEEFKLTYLFIHTLYSFLIYQLVNAQLVIVQR